MNRISPSVRPTASPVELPSDEDEVVDGLSVVVTRDSVVVKRGVAEGVVEGMADDSRNVKDGVILSLWNIH